MVKVCHFLPVLPNNSLKAVASGELEEKWPLRQRQPHFYCIFLIVYPFLLWENFKKGKFTTYHKRGWQETITSSEVIHIKLWGALLKKEEERKVAKLFFYFSAARTNNAKVAGITSSTDCEVFLRADATIFLLVLDLLLSFSQLRASWDIFQAHVFLKSQSLNMIGPKSEW